MATNAIKPPLHSTAFRFAVKNQVKNKVDDITSIIAYFPLSGNTLFFTQLVRNGPNHGWLYNHFSIRGELLAKAQAAMTKKIEKGMPGVMNPM